VQARQRDGAASAEPARARLRSTQQSPFIYPRRRTCLISLCAEHQRVIPDVHPITDQERAELQWN
jgi:hypothetical protein